MVFPSFLADFFEDFAFDMEDWPFEELEDLLRLTEEAQDVSAMQDVRTLRVDDGFKVEELLLLVGCLAAITCSSA